MKKSSRILAVALAGIAALQSFCMPSSGFRFLHPDFDPEDYDSTFTGWSADSLYHLQDSLLVVEEDTIRIHLDTMLYDVADSLVPHLDSCSRNYYLIDSTIKAETAFRHWFDSLSRKEQKRWIMENVTIPAQRHKADSIFAAKDSIQAYKDSVIAATPRILETGFIPDSLFYKRILLMTQDKHFSDISFHKLDTSYNYNFYDYPFMRKDVNATWLGVAGSAVQYYDYRLREEEENAVFFTPYRAWSYTPSTIPMYNTKTPHTELAYWGTLLSGTEKEEINLRFLTTQNITPALNVTVELNKFGGVGLMQNENTQTYDLGVTTNYLGKRYAIHAGWLHTKVTRLENGGFRDNMWIRDTTVQSREIAVRLASAENDVLRNTIFLNQTLRIPFGKDSLTTAFVGHSLDWSNYSKHYTDAISDDAGRSFYNNNFFLDSDSSADTMKVMKLDNRLYLRLRPWKDDAIVSRLDVGIGDKLLNYYDFHRDDDGRTYNGKTIENNVYAYAGVRGMVHQYFQWNATGQLYFAGHQAGDFNVDANMKVNFFPFRKARKSPLSISAFFHTDLTEPDHYQQRILLNHYRWENSFKKQSTTRVGGGIDIPYLKMNLDVAYTLKANPVFFDTLGMARQSGKPVSILSAALRKDFTVWKFHFDHRFLFQYSSDQLVAPMPLLSLNLRYYFEFTVVKDAMKMQIGANALFNTKWNMPGYNPNMGVFFNQNKQTYGACPYIDAFVNIQWKRASIFLKVENLNQGWPREDGKDYFSADGYIHTQRTFKVGIHWPFYIRPGRSHVHSGPEGHDDSHGMGQGQGHGHSHSSGNMQKAMN